MANVNLTPWHTDKWFVSPWNYLDEVMQGKIGRASCRERV